MTPQEEREIIFLKGCLSSPTLLAVASSTVEPDALSVTGGIIYTAIRELSESGTEDISPEFLAYHLSEKGLLQTIGGITTLNAIKDVGFASDIESFSRIADDIKTDGRKRKMSSVLTELADSGVDDPDEFISEIIRRIYDITETSITEGVVSAYEAGKTTRGRFPFTSTSLKSLDRVMGGFVKHEYTIVAARSSMGKTILGTQMGLMAAVEDHPTIIFSLEQSKDALMGRIHKLIPQEDLEFVPLYLMCQTDLTIGRIIATTQMMKILYDIEVVVIDYVGLIKGRRTGQSKNDFLDIVSNGIQRMSRSMDVSVIALVQLNRDSEREDREPALYDLRDSGALEQDADNVILLHRRNRDEEAAKLIIAKFREGRIGTVNVRLDQDSLCFVDV